MGHGREQVVVLLENILGPYKTFSGNERYFTCPFCSHSSRKFAYNSDTHMWHCWHCNVRGKSVFSLLKKLGVSYEVIKQFKELLTDQPKSRPKRQDFPTQLFLPIEYRPLWIPTKSYPYRHAIKYIKDRGIRVDDVARYRIGYCESGEYADRIIIPSYDADDKLNYFIGRSFNNSPLRYKNPRVSKNIVYFENMINWDDHVILCEGVFDAIAIRRNAIPLLGKFLNTAIEKKLIEHKTPRVTIFLDKDALFPAMEIERKLRGYDIYTDIVTTDQKDASEMGFEQSQLLIKSAVQTDFKNFIEHKLIGL